VDGPFSHTCSRLLRPDCKSGLRMGVSMDEKIAELIRSPAMVKGDEEDARVLMTHFLDSPQLAERIEVLWGTENTRPPAWTPPTNPPPSSASVSNAPKVSVQTNRAPRTLRRPALCRASVECGRYRPHRRAQAARTSVSSPVGAYRADLRRVYEGGSQRDAGWVAVADLAGACYEDNVYRNLDGGRLRRDGAVCLTPCCHRDRPGPKMRFRCKTPLFMCRRAPSWPASSRSSRRAGFPRGAVIGFL